MRHSVPRVSAKTARFPAVITGLGWFLLYFSVMLTILHIVGTDSGLYYRLQMRADILTYAGISEEELICADDALAGFLKGEENALEDSPFGQDEITHMYDCLNLFRLLRTAIYVMTGTGCVLLVCGICFGKYRGYCSFKAAALCFVVPVAAAVIWAVIDFDGLFTAFHKILFTNELWLMDPKTDLMIRICPESMFAAMAGIVAAGTILFILIVYLIHGIVFRRDRRRNYARI